MHWDFELSRSYLKIAWRGIVRHRAYVILNISGLAVALAACLVIGVFIYHHLSYNRFLDNSERIVRIGQKLSLGPIVARVPYGLADRISNLFPEAEIVTEMDGLRAIETPFTVDGKHFQINGVLEADERFLDVFSFEIVRGDREHPLSAPGSIVLTESTAKTIYGDVDPIGKAIRLYATSDYTVTAIAADPPRATHLRFNALSSLPKREKEIMWGGMGVQLYVKLTNGATPEDLEIKLNRLVQDTERGRHQWESGHRVIVEPLTKIHLYSSTGYEYSPNSDFRYLILFGGIGLLILSIACINYMNLATARSARRAREVGVRKVVGATRRQLIRQFLGESILFSFLAFLPALLLAYLSFPFVNTITGEELSIGMANHPAVWLGILCLLGLIGIVGGGYPALLLSGYSPEAVFKGYHVLGRSHRTARKLLVGVQVIATFTLIGGTLLFASQMEYVRTKRLGFDQSKVVELWGFRGGESKFETFRAKVEAETSIVSLATGKPPGLGMYSGWSDKTFDDSGKEYRITTLNGGYGYIETLGITLLSGRSFSKDYPGDVDGGLIVTQSLADVLDSRGELLGQKVKAFENRTIVGVVNDIQNAPLIKSASIHDDDLIAFELDPDPARMTSILVRLAPGQVQTGLQVLEAAWSDISPERPFDYHFLDERIQQQYGSETKLAKIFGLFSGLSIFVACLGLFGLAAFMAEQRTKEIGIRKAHGATVSRVVYLLSRDFALIVLTSILIGSPIVYIVGSGWLKNFSQHIEIGPGLFVVAGIISLVFVLVAVGYQSFKAALTNPSDALRHE